MARAACLAVLCLLACLPALADFKIDSARFEAYTSTGTQDYEISGFGTPKAAIVILTLATTDDTGQNSNEIIISFMDGTEQWSHATLDIDNQSTMVSCNNITTALTIMSNCSSGTGGVAAWSAWATNGVTLNWTEAAGSAWDMTIILIGGSSPSVDVGDVDLGNSSPTTRDITEPGFTPDFVFLASAFNAYGGGRASHGVMSFGGCESGGDQASLMFWSTHGLSSADVQGYMDTNAALNAETSYNTVYGTCSAFDANGFTLTVTGAASNTDAMFLAIDTGVAGAEVAIDTIASPTSSGTQAYTGFGLQGDFLIIAGSFIETEESTITNDDASSFSIGSGDTTSASVNGVYSDDGAATSNTASYTDGQLVNVLGVNSPASQMLATFSSADSDGFTLNWSTTSNVAKYQLAIAVQREEPSAAAVFPLVDNDPLLGLVDGGLAR